MQIGQFRQQYPMYGNLSDQDVAERLYREYYSDMDRNKFMSDFMGEEASIQQQAPQFSEPVLPLVGEDGTVIILC